MDNKRTVIWVVVATALALGWFQLIGYLHQKYPDLAQKPTPVPAATQPTTAPASQPGAEAAGPTTTTTTAGVTTTNPTAVAAAVPAAAAAAGLRVVEQGDPSATHALGSAQLNDPHHAMKVVLSPLGAGLDSVTLNSFYQTDEKKDLYVFQRPFDGHVNESRALATQWVEVNGQRIDLTGVPWVLRESGEDWATFALTLAQGDAPLVRLNKTFRLARRQGDSKGYELAVSQDFQNLGSQPVVVKAGIAGPTAPPSEIPGQEPQVIAAHWDDGVIALDHHTFSAFRDEKARLELAHNDKKQPLAWVGLSSEYFNAILQPAGTQVNQLSPLVASVVALAVDDTPEDKRVDHVRVAIETPPMTLQPAGQQPTTQPTTAAAAASSATASVPFTVYLGPKWRDVLATSYYEAADRRYDETLVPPRGMCGVCTFNWIISTLVWMLKGFHFVTRDWGLAIICLVILVRLLLHPVTKKSQVNMVRLGKMGPEMEALKKKYGDDKEAYSKAVWQLQKQQGMTPIWGCLPMFLQMPIWIGLYAMLQSTFELRQAPFLWGATWIDDLGQPDRLIRFAQPLVVPFVGWHVYGLNLLPVILAVVFFINQKYTPKPPPTTPEQAQQQKMMQWMSLLFPVFLYPYPSGLNLYIFTSTSIGIWESARIRRHIKEQEEIEKANKVIIDAKPTRGSRRKDLEKPAPEPPKKGLMGWIADLQAKAEQMKREQDRRGNR
jgi:YidC/Oxa1 family membrane protein insertase